MYAMCMQVHHVGYVVEDLAAGIERWSTHFGAGPFEVIEHLAFDEVTFRGAPAAYDHSSAFGQWGPVLVELTQVFSAEPPELQTMLGTPGIGHLGFLADDLDEAVAQLGLTPFHTGRSGPVEAVWLEGPGHHVEVLKRCPEILGFYEHIRAL